MRFQPVLTDPTGRQHQEDREGQRHAPVQHLQRTQQIALEGMALLIRPGAGVCLDDGGAHPDVQQSQHDLHDQPQPYDAVAFKTQSGHVNRRGQNYQHPGPDTAEHVPRHVSCRSGVEEGGRSDPDEPL